MHHLRELTFLHIEKQERVSYTKTLLLDIISSFQQLTCACLIEGGDQTHGIRDKKPL
jgi:hypothetical protein